MRAPNARPWLAALLALGTALSASRGPSTAPPVPPPAQDADPADEDAAAAALAEAEKEIVKGRYEEAVHEYEKIAERYPETPAGRVALRRTAPNAYLGCADLLRHGPSENRVDVVVMGDGYLLKKQDVFDDIAGDMPSQFEQDPILEEYYSYLNFIRANVVSEEDGIDGYGREASTALGGRIIEESTAGHVAVDVEAARNMLAEMPAQDGVAIVYVAQGTGGTGAAGIAAVGGKETLRVIRGFGQALAGLHDEYDTDDGLPRGPTPNEKNIANTEDPEDVPWAHFIEADVSGVGVYRGGDGRVKGAWRPTASNCIMGIGEFFCPVCRELILLEILDLVDPIETSHPVADEVLRGPGPHEFQVTTMKPATHILEARWWVLPEEAAPAPIVVDHPRRHERGPLAAISAEPLEESRRNKQGEHSFTVDAKKLELAPGRYRVICRVRDTALPRGERVPWVLKDVNGLLESERSWGLVVE